MKKVEVRDSKIKGKGVFATRLIAKGEVILAIDDSVVISPDDPVLSKLIGSEPDPCDYLPDGTVILMSKAECQAHIQLAGKITKTLYNRTTYGYGNLQQTAGPGAAF